MRSIRFLHRIATESAPARPLAYTRIAAGVAGLVKLIAVAPILWALTTPDAVRVPFGSAWFAFSPGVVIAVMVAWVMSAAALVVGWQARGAAIALAVVAWATLFADQQLYSNHLYLLALMATLLALSDCGATLSLDARREGHRATVPGYPLAMLRALVAIVYGFAAVSKLGLPWLSGGILALHLGTGPLPVPEWVEQVWVLAPLAWVTALAEAFLAGGLFLPRLRRAAVVCGVFLHLGIVVFLGPVLELVAFSLLMVGTYPLFLADRTPRVGTAPKVVSGRA